MLAARILTLFPIRKKAGDILPLELSSEFLAVLRAQLVCAVSALQSGVGLIPEALGMQKNTAFPDQEDEQ